MRIAVSNDLAFAALLRSSHSFLERRRLQLDEQA
jgi:hypothetical protein